VARGVQAAIQAAPAVVAVRSVGQAPGHQRLALWGGRKGGRGTGRVVRNEHGVVGQGQQRL
jgi:hypothetical protein